MLESEDLTPDRNDEQQDRLYNKKSITKVVKKTWLFSHIPHTHTHTPMTGSHVADLKVSM